MTSARRSPALSFFFYLLVAAAMASAGVRAEAQFDGRHLCPSAGENVLAPSEPGAEDPGRHLPERTSLSLHALDTGIGIRPGARTFLALTTSVQ